VYGQRKPIVVNKRNGVIEAGNGTLQAALSLNWSHIAAVYVDDDPAVAAGFSISDNRTAELAGWDKEALDKLMKEIDVGHDPRLEAMMASLAQDMGLRQQTPDGETDPDQIPEPPDEAVTKSGDVIILGNHRLLCGDSASADDLDRLLDGQVIHLVNTDPPYNVNVEPASNNADTGGQRPGKRPKRPSWRQLDERRRDGNRPPRKTVAPPKKTPVKGRRLMSDFVSDEEFGKRLLAWFGNISRVLQAGRCFYLWGGYANISNYPPALKASGLYFSQCLVWVKGHPVNEKRLHGQPRVVLLRMARRRRA
jgi:hypothetical protein